VFDWLRRGRRRDAELREELEFHLEAEARDRGAGVDARNTARRDLGNPTLSMNTSAAFGVGPPSSS
jgi:hypothetical protein